MKLKVLGIESPHGTETTNTPVTIIGTGERNCDIIDLR